MGDEQNTNGGGEQPDVVGEFDQTNGLAEGLDGDDDGALEPEPRESVFENVMRNVDDSRVVDEAGDDEDSATSYSEEGKP